MNDLPRPTPSPTRTPSKRSSTRSARRSPCRWKSVSVIPPGWPGVKPSLLVLEQLELVAVELEQRAQVDVVRRPGLLLARGDDLDQPFAIVLAVLPELVEPRLGHLQRRSAGTARARAPVVHEAAVGEVGRAGDDDAAAEDVRLAVQEALQVAADRDLVTSRSLARRSTCSAVSRGERETVAFGVELVLEVGEPLARVEPDRSAVRCGAAASGGSGSAPSRSRKRGRDSTTDGGLAGSRRD